MEPVEELPLVALQALEGTHEVRLDPGLRMVRLEIALALRGELADDELAAAKPGLALGVEVAEESLTVERDDEQAIGNEQPGELVPPGEV
jgi:hypothetical protein